MLLVSYSKVLIFACSFSFISERKQLFVISHTLLVLRNEECTPILSSLYDIYLWRFICEILRFNVAKQPGGQWGTPYIGKGPGLILTTWGFFNVHPMHRTRAFFEFHPNRYAAAPQSGTNPRPRAHQRHAIALNGKRSFPFWTLPVLSFSVARHPKKDDESGVQETCF